MTLRSSGPAANGTALANHYSDTTESTARCAIKGCCWLGTCPVHTERYPRGFKKTRALMQPEVR